MAAVVGFLSRNERAVNAVGSSCELCRPWLRRKRRGAICCLPTLIKYNFDYVSKAPVGRATVFERVLPFVSSSKRVEGADRHAAV